MDFLIGIDHTLLRFINSEATHPWLDIFFVAITDLHKTLIFKILFLVIGFGFYFWKYQKRGIFYFLFSLLAVGIGDWSASQFIKKSFERPRPYQIESLEVVKRSNAHGYSFTSNHASNMFALAWYNSQFFPKAKWFFYGMAFLVSYSRVYNGVHFPSDVLMGALWGLLISHLVFRLGRKLEVIIFRKSPAKDPLI